MNRKIPIAKPNFSNEENIAVKEVLKSGIIASGPKTKKFENEFADYIGVKHAIAVTNGTIALDVALKALNLQPGDEVITSGFSFISSGNCILFQKARPVFVDIDPKTFNIDTTDVVEKITQKTKAIIAIHMFGHPAKMDILNEISQEKNIALIEDAAQAHGAEFYEKKVGSIGDMACFSFYATKNMTTGEGGMITTNEKKIADKIRLLINHGQNRRYNHEILGYNYRMTEICAAIGLVQLRKLEKFNNKRILNAYKLNKGIHEFSGLSEPYIKNNVKHVFHQYVIRVEENYSKSRDELANLLTEKGIGNAVHYPIPIYKQNLYRKMGNHNQVNCHFTEDACTRVLSLPIHPLVNDNDLEYILNVLKEIS